MSLVHHLDTIAQNRYIYLGACNVVYAILSMKSSDGKKVDVTFELTCVCVILFFPFLLSIVVFLRISHHFNFVLLFFRL
jgi:hypothetical protein